MEGAWHKNDRDTGKSNVGKATDRYGQRKENSKEIKSGQRIYQEKPDFTRVTDVVECCQTHWKLLRVQHVCNRCATKISVIIIGHFSVKRFAGKCPFLLPESP